MFRPKAPRDARDANYDPGIEKMMEFAKKERMRARLPPLEDMVDAIRSFAARRRKIMRPMEDTYATLVLQSLRYCLKMQNEIPDEESSEYTRLTSSDLVLLAKVFRRTPSLFNQGHADVARLLFDELSGPGSSREEFGASFHTYLKCLAWSGRTRDARNLVLREETGRIVHDPVTGQESATVEGAEGDAKAPGHVTGYRWGYILTGFAEEGNEDELLHTLDLMKERRVELDLPVTLSILTFYIKKQNSRAVRQWWNESKLRAGNKGEKIASLENAQYQKAVHDLLTWCLTSNNLQLGHAVVADVMTSNPEKPIWDSVLVWGAGTKKSVDEIARMLDVMERSNESLPAGTEKRIPDSATVNALVRYAIMQEDPYMAERFIALGRDRGIQPDAETFVLQMDYRLKVNDVDGALVAYKHLQAQDLSTNSDVPAVNRLIVALCTSQRHDFETIMSVVADLSDRQANFEPLTVSTLSILHLNRDEIHDVIDLLNTHSFGFSSVERASIRKSLVDYCLDSRTTTSRAWDTYTILKSVFDEMPRDQRTDLMLNFFSHKRPDMGVNVFNHMRQHSRADTMPDNDTYVAAFLGCGKLGDLESLEVVHNQLKLDYNVNQNTYCRNALIIAYSLCDEHRAALDFWDEIVASREGPTYNSIHIALRACEKAAFGDIKAQEIWARLRRNNVDLDHSMWASYIAALAGNGDNELARSKLEEAEEKGEVQVDAFLLGSLLDAGAGQMKQKDLEMWAEERYPEVWHVLKEEVGWTVDADGMKKVKVDRTVTP